MSRSFSTVTVVLVVACACSAVVADVSRATAPPVGAAPGGLTAAIQTQTRQLVAFALPHRANGRFWRIAKPVDPQVLREVSEADVGNQVVLVFKAAGTGTAVVAFGLTRGKRQKAFESRRLSITVRP